MCDVGANNYSPLQATQPNKKPSDRPHRDGRFCFIKNSRDVSGNVSTSTMYGKNKMLKFQAKS